MHYIQSDASNIPNGWSLHLITLLHGKEPVPLTPRKLLISGYGQVILFFFCGQTNIHCLAFKMGRGNLLLAQVQQSSV